MNSTVPCILFFLNPVSSSQVLFQSSAEPVTNSLFNLLLFTVAPKPTSPDVLTLSIKDAPTTPQSALDVEAVQNPDPLRPLNTEPPSTSDTGVMSSGAEPESSSLDVLGDLTVNVTSTSVSLAWSAPDEAFDSFLVELGAPSGVAQAHVTTLPGSARKAEIEGLSPSTHYEITVQGLVEEGRSLPLRGFATTGTWKQIFLLVGIHHPSSSHPFIFYALNMSGWLHGTFFSTCDVLL